MAPTPVISVADGPRLTVATMMKSPTLIPKRIISMLDQQFLVDVVLRNGGSAPSGTVLFYESTPLFSNDDPQVLDEFGEIPTTNGSLGSPKTVRVVRRSLGLRVSKTMQDRNNVDAVNVQITQIKNTMVRAWEDAFFSAVVANPAVWVSAATAVWSSGSSAIRKDINTAKFVIKNSSTDGNGQNGKQKLGFNPDTLIISTVSETDFLNSSEVQATFAGGNIADESLQYTGKMPRKFLDLNVVTSWRLDTYLNGCAIVLERGTLGFISDERSLEATPMYGEGGGPNGGPTESWRTDTTRASAIGLDQPMSACIITGVHA